MRPFCGQNLENHLASNTKRMEEHIDSYTQETLVANELNQLIDECYERFYIETVEIHEEDKSLGSIKQCKVERQFEDFRSGKMQLKSYPVEGMEIIFVYPLSGDISLLQYRASTYSTYSFENVELVNESITIFYHIDSELAHDTEQVMKSIENRLLIDRKRIQENIGFINADIQKHNKYLKLQIEKLITNRRDNTLKLQKMALMLQIPLIKSEYGSTHIPLIRREIPLKKSIDRENSYNISDDDYYYIIDTIKHNCSTYERTPGSCAKLHEEDLRNFLLAALNGMYKGIAGGETFRKKGKTDICIEQENRSAFVAECKMWTGQAAIPDAINQLIGYLTWRDCKCALVYFCKVSGFKKICDTAFAAVKNIPEVSQFNQVSINEISFRLPRPGSSEDYIDLRLMLYDLHIEK